MMRLRRLSEICLISACLVFGGCTATPAAWQSKTASVALPPADTTELAKLAATGDKHGGRSGFRMITTGIDGLLARVEIIDRAQQSLDLQYYIFRADDSGKIVSAALLRAADRGVRVRIIIDDGETVAGDERILALAANRNIEIRIFNAFRYRGHARIARAADFLINKRRLDYRMHNKLLVADNVVALIGGRNVGDQYFQIDPGSQFGDDDVLAAGPVIQELSGVFDEFWNSTLCVPATLLDRKHTSATALQEFKKSLPSASPADPNSDNQYLQRLQAQEPLHDILSGQAPLSWARCKLAYDSPDKRQVTKGGAAGSLLFVPVEEQARGVQSSMLVVTPYLVPTAEEMKLLETDTARGAHIKILTNSLASAPDLAAHAGYTHYRAKLLADGVNLFEIRPALGNTRGTGQNRAMSRRGNYALHAKIFVFDETSVFIGSMNLDSRSRRLNTEIGIIIDSSELAQQAAQRFAALTSPENAYEVSLRRSGNKDQLVWSTREAQANVEYLSEPTRSRWQKLKLHILSMAPIDREL